MTTANGQPWGRLRKWLFVPLWWVICAPFLVVGFAMLLGGTALLFVWALFMWPYVALYPDHWDERGWARSALLARWRDGYRRLGFFGRVRRSAKVWRRQRIVARQKNRVPLRWEREL